MGRRGSFRGRSRYMTVSLFVACLTVFYLSWKLLISDVIGVDSAQQPSRSDDNGKLQEISKTYEKVLIKRFDLAQGNRVHKAVFHQTEASYDKGLSKKSVARKEHITGNIKQTFQLFQQMDNSVVNIVTLMEKYVHLDLKGAPPKIFYLKSFIHLLKRLGATGLLIEYEDMFPYTGKLKNIRAKNSYSKEDIKELMQFTKRADLTLMPLIPTFGHMEFVLKSEYRKLRESDYTPQVIDITQEASYELIAEMIKQILNGHPGITHLHIGCDEVYELGKGASAVEMRRRNVSASEMFLQHVVRVAHIVREQAHNVTPVLWDDELRKIKLQDLEDSGLPSLVEIMVWQYSTNVFDSINSRVWVKYAKLFKSVWIASSFKGSTGPRQIFTEPRHHLNIHLSWLKVIAAYKSQLIFKGIALTGWQRYDHFSTLCELLPVAIPSLAICLTTVVNAGFTKSIHRSASKLIDCEHPVDMGLPTSHQPVVNDCMFPGHEVYYAVQDLYKVTASDTDTGNILDGWLSDYQVTHAFSNPGLLKVLSRSLAKQRSRFQLIARTLTQYLAFIYTKDTVDEWIDENIQERLRHIISLQEKIKFLQQNRFWQRRPMLPVTLISANYINNASKENREDQLTAT